MGKSSKKQHNSVCELLSIKAGRQESLRTHPNPPREKSSQKIALMVTYLFIVLIVGVSFSVYFNALFNDFAYDDKDQIVDNSWIRDIKNVPAIFSSSVWSFQSRERISNYYRPLMHIVYMFNYHIFGLKPWGFHLVNILFHCGASVLVFLIVRSLMSQYGAASSPVYLSPPFLAAMLFASHPIHTEAVTWIAGLPDVGLTFFYLLSLYYYILFRNGVKRVYLLSVLSFGVATLFKEPALTLTIILIAYDYLFKKRERTNISEIQRYIPYAIVSAVYLFMRYYALRSFVPNESYAGLNTYQYIINVFPLIREYFTSVLWPFDLNLWHTFHPVNSLIESQMIISIVVTAIFLIAVVEAHRKDKVLLFSLLLFIIPLLPVFYIKGIGGKPFAERYLYLPSVGFVLFLATLLSLTRKKLPRIGKSISIFLLVVIGLYSVVTIDRNNVWKNDFTLWSDTAKKSPDSDLAHNNLGIEYMYKRQWDLAMEEFRAASVLNPGLAEPHFNLGVIYLSKGMKDTARKEFELGLERNPNDKYAREYLNSFFER